MKKRFALLITLFLLVVLSYFCFISKAPQIKNDILTELNNSFTIAQMKDIKVKGLEGNHLKQTRTVILEGTAKDKEERKKAEAFAKKIKGVSNVKNYITIPYKEPDAQTIARMTKKEKPIYKISASKAKGNKVVMVKGFISNEKEHQALILEAKKLFGKINIIDELEEKAQTPDNWYKSAKLGIELLNFLDYGHFEIDNNKFRLQGFTQTIESKTKILKYLNKKLNKEYISYYKIDTAPIQDLCQKQINHLLLENKVYFQHNSAKIKKSSHKLLNTLAQTLNNTCVEDFIMIEGHTDSKGQKVYNQKLSTKRANSVKKYLIKQGIQKNRIEAIGYGESQPIASNKTKKGQKQNRRIEFKIQNLK